MIRLSRATMPSPAPTGDTNAGLSNLTNNLVASVATSLVRRMDGSVVHAVSHRSAVPLKSQYVHTWTVAAVGSRITSAQHRTGVPGTSRVLPANANGVSGFNGS